jgi:hypothetical protein
MECPPQVSEMLRLEDTAASDRHVRFGERGVRGRPWSPRSADGKQVGRWSLERLVAVEAIAVGLMARTYGIASAAGGSSSSQSVASSSNAQSPWAHQRSDETLLSGDTAAKVRQVALAKVPGGTIVRARPGAGRARTLLRGGADAGVSERGSEPVRVADHPVQAP